MKLNEKPFYLSEKDIEWVKETLASMSVEKIGQLFCLTDMITDEEQLKEMIRKYKPGGFMYRPEMPWKSRMPSVLCRNKQDSPFVILQSGKRWKRRG